MTDQRITLKLESIQQAAPRLTKAWAWIRTMLAEGHTLLFEVVAAKSREQEGLYHSCFADLARDCLYSGQKVEPEVWKRGLLQAFYEVTRHDADFADDWASRAPKMIPTLEGGGFLMIGVESKRFTKNLARAFITFVHSEGDARGVTWSKTSLGRDWPDEQPARRVAESEPA